MSRAGRCLGEAVKAMVLPLESGGPPGGASVWYTWTAPATGSARLSSQGNWFEPLLAIYSGSALNALSPLAWGGFLGTEVPVTAGTTYRIAVDGKRDSGSGEADTASFTLMLFMQLPLQPKIDSAPNPTPSSSPADVDPPNTIIHKRKMRPRKRRATFAFDSSELGSTFRCKLDKRPFAPCVSPKTYRNLGSGPHTFKVVAIDGAGNADPWPAIAHFNIPNPRKPRKD